MLEGLPHGTIVRSDSHHADLRSLPQFLMFDLGYRYIEIGAKAILQSANYHAFVFERVRLRNVYIQREQRNHSRHHLRFSSWRFLAGAGGFHAFHEERFDGVSDFEIVVVMNADTAFISACD